MRKIESIEGLRVILFMMIFFFHCEAFLQGTYVYDNFLNGAGTLSVCFFFVISGFVLGIKEEYIYLNLKSRIKKRFNKIYFLHILALLLYLPLYYWLRGGYELISIPKIAINALLIQSWFPYEGIWLGFNGVTWYISTLLFICSVEPYIYKIFKGLEKRNLDKVALLIICIMEIFLALLVNQNEKYWLYAFPPIRILDYLCGMIIGNIFRKKKYSNLYNSNIKELVCVLGFFLLMYLYHMVDEGVRRVALYLPFVCYALYVLSFETGVVSKLLKKFAPYGRYTLTLYIVHQVVINYVRSVEIFMGNNLMRIIGVIVSLMVTIFCVACFERIYSIRIKNKQFIDS